MAMSQPRSSNNAPPAPERKMRPLPSMDNLPSMEALPSVESSMEASMSQGAVDDVEDEGPKASAKRRLSKKGAKPVAKVRVKRKSESNQAADASPEGQPPVLPVAVAPESSGDTSAQKTPRKSISELPASSSAEGAPMKPRKSAPELSAASPGEGVSKTPRKSVPEPAASSSGEGAPRLARKSAPEIAAHSSGEGAPRTARKSVPETAASSSGEGTSRSARKSVLETPESSSGERAPKTTGKAASELPAASSGENSLRTPRKSAPELLPQSAADPAEAAHSSAGSKNSASETKKSDAKTHASQSGTDDASTNQTADQTAANETEASPVTDNKHAAHHAGADQLSGHTGKSAEKGKRRLTAPATVALSPVEEGNEDEEDLPLEERPEVEVEDGSRYTGQWRGSHRHGQGSLVRRDGFKYEGSFSSSKAHGYGIFTSQQGMYEGEWANDRAHGRGKYLHADGSTYEGEWHQDNKHGSGEEAWADGSKYRGEFKKGEKHGKGTYQSASGVSYEGQFADDRMDGYGIYMFPDGRTHIGQWRNGHMNGSGTMQWPNGCKYSGSYKDDLKHGEGSFKWPDGRAYHGQWHLGKQHGTGVLVNAEGVERRAVWQAGECVSCHPDSKSTMQHISSATTAAALGSGSSRSSKADGRSPTKPSPKSPIQDCGSDSDASSEEETVQRADPSGASRRANDLLLLQAAATPKRKRPGSADSRAEDEDKAVNHQLPGKGVEDPADHTDDDPLTPDGSEEESSPESKSSQRPSRALPVDKGEAADGSRLGLKVAAPSGSAHAEAGEEVSLRSPRAEASTGGAGKAAPRSLAGVPGEPASQAPGASTTAAAGSPVTTASGPPKETSKLAPTDLHSRCGRGPDREHGEKEAPSQGLSLLDMMAAAVQSVEDVEEPAEDAAERETERLGTSESVHEQRGQSSPDGNRTAAPLQEQAKTLKDEAGVPRRSNAEGESAMENASSENSPARQREGTRPVLSAKEKFYRDIENPISYHDMMQWMYQLTIDPSVMKTLREETANATRCGCLGTRRSLFDVPRLKPPLCPAKDFVLNLALTDFDPNDAVHWRMLRTVHTTLTRSKECPWTGRHWEVLGFSSPDPCRDLNNSAGSRRFPYPGGVLNVIHLFFFLTHHMEALRHIYLTAIQEGQGFKLFGISVQMTRIVMGALLSGKLTKLLNNDPSIWPDNSVYTMLCRIHNAGLFNFYMRWQRITRQTSSSLSATYQKVQDLVEAKPERLLEEFRSGMRDLEASAQESGDTNGSIDLDTEKFIAGSGSSRSRERGGSYSAASQMSGKRQMSDIR